jgi:hypothetical protein
MSNELSTLITHSVRSDFTGLAAAALNVRIQSIVIAMPNMIRPPRKNIHILMLVLYEKF